MSACPVCGLPPTVTTQDDKTGQPYYECPNSHFWQDADGDQ